MTFHPISVLPLFLVLVLLLEAGRVLRARNRSSEPDANVRSAILGILSLLLAFSFSGASGRLDAHRQLITQEANKIRAAYLRIDLVAPENQPQLRDLFRQYTAVRMRESEDPDESVATTEQRQADLQRTIWNTSIAATTGKPGSPDGRSLLPAVLDMIDIATTRQSAFKNHPPQIITLLLFGLSGLYAFIAGYSVSQPTAMDGHGIWTRPHLLHLIFLAAITFTIYVTLEIEYPMIGFIKMISYDQVFTNLQNLMK